jgi:putative alpha-1,2-mannosidase
MDAKGLGQTHLNLSRDLTGSVYQSGALFSYTGRPKQVNIRVGVSFRSAEQACANAESEIGSSSFEDILAKAKTLWQEKLSKIEIDIANTPANITEMLYSSLYRASLTPVRYPLVGLKLSPHKVTEQCYRRDARSISGHDIILF